MSAPVGALLAEIDSLSYPRRVRLLAARARTARCLPDAAPDPRRSPGRRTGDWSLLGKRYPEVVADAAGEQLAGLSQPDQVRWWAHFGRGVLQAAAAVPERILDLLERYGPDEFVPGETGQFRFLAAADPDRLIGLLAAPERTPWLIRLRLSQSLLRLLARLDTERVAPLAQRVSRGGGSRRSCHRCWSAATPSGCCRTW